jgi:hypothetical protein
MAPQRCAAAVTCVLVALVISSTLGENLPQDVADKFGAKCSSGTSSNKYVLFLEGGGWHFIPGAAVEPNTFRGHRVGGSGQPARTADIGGVMSADAGLNPDFYSWNKIFMH